MNTHLTQGSLEKIVEELGKDGFSGNDLLVEIGKIALDFYAIDSDCPLSTTFGYGIPETRATKLYYVKFEERLKNIHSLINR